MISNKPLTRDEYKEKITEWLESHSLIAKIILENNRLKGKKFGNYPVKAMTHKIKDQEASIHEIEVWQDKVILKVRS